MGHRQGSDRLHRLRRRLAPTIDNIDVSSDGLTATLHFKELYAGWLGFLTGAFFQADWLKSVPVKDAVQVDADQLGDRQASRSTARS